MIKYTEKRGIEDKGGFLKTYYDPGLDIYSLDDQVKKDEQKKIVEEIEKKKAELNVFNQIDLYIKSKINKVSKGMPAIYRNMKDHLLAYQKARKITLTFESFNLDYYEDFVEFLSHEYVQSRFKVPIVGLKNNTVGKTINQLRIFLINRAKRKIIAPIDLSDWHVFNEEVDADEAITITSYLLAIGANGIFDYVRPHLFNYADYECSQRSRVCCFPLQKVSYFRFK